MERLLHYVWKNRLMPRQGLVTTDGRRVEVLSPGFHNKDAGPDFFCADIVIDGEDWMGNVEILTGIAMVMTTTRLTTMWCFTW